MIDAEAKPPAVRVVPREKRDEDEAFIIDTWRRTWRNSNEVRNEARSGRAYHALFESVVLDGAIVQDETRFQVLATEVDLDEIVAWICYAPGPVPTVHFAYVRAATRRTKEPVRRAGVLASMISMAGVRDRLVYTFRPAERPHPRDKRTLGVENALLDAAKQRGILAVYRPILEYLGRAKDRDDG